MYSRLRTLLVAIALTSIFGFLYWAYLLKVEKAYLLGYLHGQLNALNKEAEDLTVSYDQLHDRMDVAAIKQVELDYRTQFLNPETQFVCWEEYVKDNPNDSTVLAYNQLIDQRYEEYLKRNSRDSTVRIRDVLTDEDIKKLFNLIQNHWMFHF